MVRTPGPLGAGAESIAMIRPPATVTLLPARTARDVIGTTCTFATTVVSCASDGEIAARSTSAARTNEAGQVIA
jgi:hypothetical protein